MEDKGKGDEKRRFKRGKDIGKKLTKFSRFPLIKPPPHPYIDSETQRLRIGEEGRKWGKGGGGWKNWGERGIEQLPFSNSSPLPSSSLSRSAPPPPLLCYMISQNPVRSRQRAMFCLVLKSKGRKLKQAIEGKFPPYCLFPPSPSLV